MHLLLAKAEYPDAPLDLQLHIGWLALLLLSLLLLWVWTRAEPLRRAIQIDPKPFYDRAMRSMRAHLQRLTVVRQQRAAQVVCHRLTIRFHRLFFKLGGTTAKVAAIGR